VKLSLEPIKIDDILSDRRINIKLRFHSSIMDRVLDFCAFESFFPDGNEHFIAEFPFVENDFTMGFSSVTATNVSV
jgi:hypothetical protein